MISYNCKDSWHSGLLSSLFSSPFPASSLLHTRQTGRALHQACNVLLKSLYGLILAALGFCLVEERTAFLDHVIYHLCVSLLEMDRIGDFSMLFLLFPSTKMACCLSQEAFKSAVEWCWPSVLGISFIDQPSD